MKHAALVSLIILHCLSLSCGKPGASGQPTLPDGPDKNAAGEPVDPDRMPQVDLAGLTLDDLGIDWPRVKGLPAVSADGQQILELERRFFTATFVAGSEEEETYATMAVVVRSVPDRRELKRFELLTQAELRQAHDNARDAACLEKLKAGPSGSDEEVDTNQCPRDPQREAAELERLKKVMTERVAPILEAVKAQSCERLEPVLRSDHENKDGAQILYLARTEDHRTQVKLVRTVDDRELAQATLACVALPESSCALQDDVEVYWSARHRLAWVHASEIDSEAGRSIGDLFVVLRWDEK